MATKIERIKRIFHHYGAKAQLLKCAEECAEFQTELLKGINGKGNRGDILTELADILITLEYVKMAYDFSDEEIEHEQIRKIVRQEQRML